MAKLSSDKTYVTVEAGDTLSDIAKKYLGSASKYKTLASINNISNPNLIYIGQIIYLKSSGGSSSTGTGVDSNKVEITQFGLQATDENTLFVTWKWSRKNTESFKVVWNYGTGDNVAFVGSSSEVKIDKELESGGFTGMSRQSTYQIPGNAVSVQVRILPISEKKKSGSSEVSYWEAKWSEIKTWRRETLTIDPPPTPTVDTEDLKDLIFTTSISGLEDLDVDGIQFEIVQDNSVAKTRKCSINMGFCTSRVGVKAGYKYKARARSYKEEMYSEWSDYTDIYETRPVAPEGIAVIRAEDETSVYLEWSESATATGYVIEHATDEKYFDTSSMVTAITVDKPQTKWLVTDLASGSEYYFRVKATNENGESEWTDVKSVLLGTKPIAPTTWSSSTTVIVGETVNLYWVHNCEDGSSETYADLELYIDGTKHVIGDIKKSAKKDEKDKTSIYAINTSEAPYANGATIEWRVRTAGVTKEYGGWSIQRTINVYAKPTIKEIYLTDEDGHKLESEAGADDEIHFRVTKFPFLLFALPGTTGDKQSPIGYYLSVTANKGYETTDSIGNVKMVSAGDSVYSKHFDTNADLGVVFDPGNIDLQDGIEYTITCVVSMDSGLTATAEVVLDVFWEDEIFEPNMELGIDTETYTAYIRPYCQQRKTVAYLVDKVNVELDLDEGIGESGHELSVGVDAIELVANYTALSEEVITKFYNEAEAEDSENVINIVSTKLANELQKPDETDADWRNRKNSIIEIFEEAEDPDATVYYKTKDGCDIWSIDTDERPILCCVDGGTTYLVDNIGDILETFTVVSGEPLVCDRGNKYTTSNGEVIYRGVGSFLVGEDESGVPEYKERDVLFCYVEEVTPITDVYLSVYRREFDGSFVEIASGLDGTKSVTVSDPHPALNYARYRIVAKHKTTGAISYYDPPSYLVDGKEIIIQWDEQWSWFETNEENPLEQPPWTGSMLKLPYNIDVSDSNSPDVSFVEYVGRTSPVSYYGTHIGQTATWNVTIERDDEETLYALRRLARWMGDVYVREPSGSGYWAHITVSFSQKHLDLTIPVTITLKRVEGGI